LDFLVFRLALLLLLLVGLLAPGWVPGGGAVAGEGACAVGGSAAVGEPTLITSSISILVSLGPRGPAFACPTHAIRDVDRRQRGLGIVLIPEGFNTTP
jgi:hypothetical protein